MPVREVKKLKWINTKAIITKIIINGLKVIFLKICNCASKLKIINNKKREKYKIILMCHFNINDKKKIIKYY